MFLALAGPAVAKPAGEPAVYVYRTNYVSQWITNQVEISMPVNRFVNLFRTNYIDRYLTNQVELFRTNTHAVSVIHTNLVQAYHTNLQTLQVTNWTTVLVFKTNWVTVPVTNVAEVQLTRTGTGSETPSPATRTPAARTETTQAAMATDALSVEARKTGRTFANKQIEVQFSVRPAKANARLQEQQWRIESTDGSFLCCGQGPDFKRELAPGSYKLEVRAQRGSGYGATLAKGTLALTATDLVLQPRTPKL